MKLADKGPIKPPPALKGPAQLVSQEIQSGPGIVAATHWFLYDRTKVDGADFYVGEWRWRSPLGNGTLWTVGKRENAVELAAATGKIHRKFKSRFEKGSQAY